MAREDLHFRLRIPEDLKSQIEAQAEVNNRSMTAEIISRLQATFDQPPFDVRSEAVRAIVENQAKTLQWMLEQQSASTHLLEIIAATDGHLKPEFMEFLRGMLARRGEDTGFPELPSED